MNIKKYITKKFLKALENLQYGSMSIETPDGKRHEFKGEQEGEHANFYIYDWKVIPNILAKGDVGFAETYRDELWDSDDLANLLIVGLKNARALDSYIYGGVFSNFTSKFLYFLRRNTVKGSKRNIHAHYDLGNDFYSLWLDPTMTYSSAIFKGDESLLEAQNNKYDRILERLESSSGNLLEVGCGWGGFAERAAKNHDFDIKGITISNEQGQFAKQRLGDKADIVLEDYRKQQGKYDHIVSIEMFEAVGEKFWPVYFEKMKSLLKEKGKALVQTITIGDEYFYRYRKTGDMIRTFIFPGGMLPSAARFKSEVEKAGLRITDNFAFGKDYALTLKHWLDGFEESLPQVRALNFDEKFIRIWRFYLSVCIASFSVERTNVSQFEIQHA